MMELEAQCDVAIYDEDAMEIRSLADAIRHIIETRDEAAQRIGIAASDCCGAFHADAGRGVAESLQGWLARMLVYVELAGKSPVSCRFYDQPALGRAMTIHPRNRSSGPVQFERHVTTASF